MEAEQKQLGAEEKRLQREHETEEKRLKMATEEKRLQKER